MGYHGTCLRDIWNDFYYFKLLFVTSVKWYHRHFFDLSLSGCHSLHLYQCSLSISVKLTTKKQKNCPKPRANLVSDVRQMTQFFLFLGSFPLSKTGMQGKTVSDRHSERKTNKQQHCLTLSSDTNNLITACVTQRKYKRITILFFDFMTPWNGWCSYDSSGFRPV